MALTKADLVEKSSSQTLMNKRDAKDFVELFFSEMIDGILQEGVVKLSGFGNFVTRDKDSRPGRNPKTGEYVEITARRVVTFHAGQKLKNNVENFQGKVEEE